LFQSQFLLVDLNYYLPVVIALDLTGKTEPLEPIDRIGQSIRFAPIPRALQVLCTWILALPWFPEPAESPREAVGSSYIGRRVAN
jgi:hypothetical protein